MAAYNAWASTIVGRVFSTRRKIDAICAWTTRLLGQPPSQTDPAALVTHERPADLASTREWPDQPEASAVQPSVIVSLGEQWETRRLVDRVKLHKLGGKVIASRADIGAGEKPLDTALVFTEEASLHEAFCLDCHRRDRRHPRTVVRYHPSLPRPYWRHGNADRHADQRDRGPAAADDPQPMRERGHA